MNIPGYRHILWPAACGAAFLALAGCATYPVGVNEAVYSGGYYGGPAYYPGYYDGGFVGGYYGYGGGWYDHDHWYHRASAPPPVSRPAPAPSRPWFAPPGHAAPHPAPAPAPAGHPKPWFAP